MSGLWLTREASRPWWPIAAAVVAFIAFVTVGWSLIAATMPDEEAVGAGTRVTVQPDGDAVITVVGGGWRVSRSNSLADQRYQLRRGGLTLVVRYVPLPSKNADVWGGLTRVARVADGTVGPPHPTLIGGVPGQTGTLTRRGQTGTVTAVVAPTGDYAVESAALGPPGTDPADRAAADDIVRSLTFRKPA